MLDLSPSLHTARAGLRQYTLLQRRPKDELDTWAAFWALLYITEPQESLSLLLWEVTGTSCPHWRCSELQCADNEPQQVQVVAQGLLSATSGALRIEARALSVLGKHYH